MPRYSPQMRQERRSRNQLATRFDDLGWIVDRIETDLGEDLRGRIFQDGESTGLSFDIQLKSTANIDKHRLTQSQDFTYAFEVKDLTHWEVASTPTVLIVWDINRKSGYWVTIANAIPKLDKNNSAWRNGQKSVHVHFPKAQTTDDKGLTVLRLHLITECQDSIKRWFLKNLDLTFPRTPKAQTDLEAFLRNQDTGEQVTIEGNYIRLNERDARLLGPILDWNTTLTFGTSPSQETYPIRVEIEGADGSRAEIPYIELRLVKKGKKEFTYANGHPKSAHGPARKASPLLFSLIQRSDQEFPQFAFSVVGSHPTVQELYAAMPFVRIALTGGRLRMVALRPVSNHESNWGECPAQNPNFSREFEQLIDMLCAIERRTGASICVPDWRISAEDTDAIHILLEATATGRAFRIGMPVKLRLNKDLFRETPQLLEKMLSDLEKSQGYTSLQTSAENQSVELLGTSIALGPCIFKSTGRIALSTDELRNAILADASSDEMPVNLVDTISTIEYLSWSKTDTSGDR